MSFQLFLGEAFSEPAPGNHFQHTEQGTGCWRPSLFIQLLTVRLKVPCLAGCWVPRVLDQVNMNEWKILCGHEPAWLLCIQGKKNKSRVFLSFQKSTKIRLQPLSSVRLTAENQVGLLSCRQLSLISLSPSEWLIVPSSHQLLR